MDIFDDITLHEHLSVLVEQLNHMQQDGEIAHKHCQCKYTLT